MKTSPLIKTLQHEFWSYSVTFHVMTLTPLSLLQEVFTEMEEKYGEVEEMNVCDNLGDHLVGNVYVKVGARRQWGSLPTGYERGMKKARLLF